MCDLLTQQLAAKLIPAATESTDAADTGSICNYTDTSPADSGQAYGYGASLQHAANDANHWNSFLQGNGFNSGTTVTVNGLGKQASANDTVAEGVDQYSVAWIHGSDIYLLTADPPTSSVGMPVVIAVAKQIDATI